MLALYSCVMRTRLKYLAVILPVYALAYLSLDVTRPWDPRDDRSSLVPLKNLEHVQYGMSEGQVAAILGRPGYWYNPYPDYNSGITCKQWWVVEEGYIEIHFGQVDRDRWVSSQKFFPVPSPPRSYLSRGLRRLGFDQK
jgi:hypothetical protein